MEAPRRASGTVPLGGPAETEPSASPDEAEAAPRTIGRFEIHSLLGKGGMARVYRAFDPTLDRLVALKVLHAPAGSPAEAAEQQRKRILREARAAAALTHPNTVTIYEVGEADGLPFIAMELLSGTTLRAAAQEQLTLGTRLRWLHEAARALHAAHERGLVHRDVKPENMIIEADGRLKLLDFGIAKRGYGEAEAALEAIGLASPEGPSSLRTSEGRRLGTPRYMAPEQCKSESTDARTDQYAWALVAFELLTGALPEQGLDLRAALRAHDVPETVTAIVVRALSESMAARADSMLGIAATLEQALATTPENGGTVVKAPAEHAAEPTTLDPPASRRWTRWPLVAGVAALGIIAGVAAVRARLHREQPGVASACRVVSSVPIPGFAPDQLALLSATKMIGTFDAARADAPPGLVRLVGGDASETFALPLALPGAMIRATTWNGKPAAATLVNRSPDGAPPDSLLSTAVDGRFVQGNRIDLTSTGAAAASFGAGVLVAITGHDALAVFERHVIVMWLRTGQLPERFPVHDVQGSFIDAPAIATNGMRVAIAFRQDRKIYQVSLDEKLERLGDAQVVAEGEVGAPAIAFVRESLVVAWPERSGAGTRLYTSALGPGTDRFPQGTRVSDDAVPLFAPALVPLGEGGALLAWIANTASGSLVRGVRLLPRPSAILELGKSNATRALTGRATAGGAVVGWVETSAQATQIVEVGCGPSPSVSPDR